MTAPTIILTDADIIKKGYGKRLETKIFKSPNVTYGPLRPKSGIVFPLSI